MRSHYKFINNLSQYYYFSSSDRSIYASDIAKFFRSFKPFKIEYKKKFPAFIWIYASIRSFHSLIRPHLYRVGK